MYYNNKKLLLSFFWLILGIILTALSFIGILDSSIYSGMGGGLIAVGMIQIIRNLKYRKDSDYKEKIDLEYSDERNQFLRLKSWSWAGYTAILIEGIGMVAAAILEQNTIQLVLSFSICLIVVVYWIAYIILSKKY